MPSAHDVLRSAKELRDVQEKALDTLSAGGKSVGDGATALKSFFHNTDNLLALAICLIALVGMYRLLKAERIIPSFAGRRGGLFSSPTAQRLAVRFILFVVVASLGLALAMGRITKLVEMLRQFF